MKQDIMQMFNYYIVVFDEDSDEAIVKKVYEDGGIIDEQFNQWKQGEDIVISGVSSANIEKYNLEDYVKDYDEYDEVLLGEYLIDKIGKYPHYLVFASGCRWNGASGYTICDNILKTVSRDYDISLYEDKPLKNGYAFTESSHDVPMGSTTYIIGLTEQEYERLEDAEFNEVEEFVNKHDI